MRSANSSTNSFCSAGVRPCQCRARARFVISSKSNEAFDFDEMTKRALARHWHGRTPAEQKEFVELFADLMERSYVSKLELYAGEKIRYTGESAEGELATVRT